MTTKSTIGTGWRLTLTGPHPDAPADLHGRSVPATVPGCVHTDLLAAGLLADPYVGLNEAEQHWIGRSDWTWSTSFDCPDVGGAARRELVFHGLDTVAEISVNGHVVGRTANMHRTHAFDVTELVRPTGNDLEVHIGSVYAYTDARRAESGELPTTYDEPFNHVRKMAANFGWDWGPTLVTAGIWKPVELLSWSGARLESVRPAVAVARPGQDGPVTVTARVAVRRAPDAPPGELVLTATVAGQRATGRVPVGADTAELTVEVPDGRLWWPIGLGEQPLYDLTVELTDNGGPVDRWSRRIGLRTTSLHTAPDRAGTPFEILVNGVHVPVRGVNWIPEDCFVSRLGRDDYAAALDHAVEANVNLMRVWGGGIYEKDEFYDLCDERGLLVWQDFLFACATYSEEEPLRGEVLAEARDNVTRLAPHPSLVLWNGNNENLWGFRDWGWPETLGDRSWGLGYYTDLLPGVVAELDPTRPYWPGSPYSGSPDLHPNDPLHGPIHIWDVWNERDWTAYAEYQPRFVAEFGFQGPACWPTTRRAINDGPPAPTGPVADAHQKAKDGVAKLQRGVLPHLPGRRRKDPEEEMADWIYLAQLNQARAVRFGVDHLRGQWPRCSGTILWQLNDCWPVASWATVDGDGHRKLAWYALRAAYQPRHCAVSQAAGRRPFVRLTNNGGDPWRTEITVQVHTVAGEPLSQDVHPVALPNGATTSLPVELPVGDAAVVVTVRDGAQVLDRILTAEDITADLPAARFSVITEAAPDGVRVRVLAHTFLRDVVLHADRLDDDAYVDEQMVTLLPGEEHVFHARTTASADDPRWQHPLTVRCVNDLVGF
ncbi:glycosyl hydrolase 2 galactose-binding domain-containing protein [Streptomyces griseoluteus]|uniref:glycoside hydrolase family 2 protein n=1 Tax=Streptomyces griseoluteus TaxID=29306 RepID=UPI00380CA6F9